MANDAPNSGGLVIRGSSPNSPSRPATGKASTALASPRLAEIGAVPSIGSVGDAYDTQSIVASCSRGNVTGSPEARVIASSRMANARSFDYANTYLISNPWQGGAAMAIEYQSASDHMKLHHRQCADIRFLSSAKDIRPLQRA